VSERQPRLATVDRRELMSTSQQLTLTPDGRTLLEDRATELRDHTIPTLHAAVVDGHRHDWSPRSELDRAHAELLALETTLRAARAVPAETDRWTVELGDAVTVEFPRRKGRRRVERFRLVHPLEAPLDEERISADSPLARALLGRAIGETISVEAPAGSYRVRILATRRPTAQHIGKGA
jgi:transcription elongation factor GreA